MLDTRIHELLHKLVQNHGTEFKRLADIVNKNHGTHIAVKASAELRQHKRVYKYHVYCTCCGATWKYMRMCDSVKYYDRSYCTKCGREKGRLKVKTLY